MNAFTNTFGIAIAPLGSDGFQSSVHERLYRDGLRRIIAALAPEISDNSRDHAVSELLQQILGKTENEKTLIEVCRSTLREISVTSEKITMALERRAERVGDQIRPHLLDGSTLDWGCGDCLVTDAIDPPDCHLLDIEDQRTTLQSHPFYLYDEQTTPSSLAALDISQVLVLTVLHHAQNPCRTLGHIFNLNPRRIVVIESVPEVEHPALDQTKLTPQDRQTVQYNYCGFADWFYNRVIHEDVQVTYNYLWSSAWDQLFELGGYQEVCSRELGIDHNIIPEWHVLKVYEKYER